MSIQANCPGCGAQINVEESGGQVTCPYCSAQFEVNMDGVQVKQSRPRWSLADNPFRPSTSFLARQDLPAGRLSSR
jgi:uncharacterized Zn finger protein (UPF0148 family)